MWGKYKNKGSCDYKEIMPSEVTFSACVDRSDCERHYNRIINGYDFLVSIGSITKYQRCELVDKLSEEYEKRLSVLFSSEDFRNGSEQ